MQHVVQKAFQCLRLCFHLWCHTCGIPSAHEAPRSMPCRKDQAGGRRACSMLLMKVCGEAARGVSTTNAIMVGKLDAKASVMMAPCGESG